MRNTNQVCDIRMQCRYAMRIVWWLIIVVIEIGLCNAVVFRCIDIHIIDCDLSDTGLRCIDSNEKNKLFLHNSIEAERLKQNADVRPIVDAR